MNCEVDVGEHDWQANPDEVLKLASRVGFEVNIVPGRESTQWGVIGIDNRKKTD